MNKKRKSQVSIIGGADGPTSVFVVGHSGKRLLKNRIKNCIYKYRGKTSREPDHVISMDFHLYEIRIDGGSLEIAIDSIWNIFGISYSGNKKGMKQLQKISKDMYSYYGVSEEDIKQKTKRYFALVAYV